ncbi:hypothetical protein Rhe02_24170 [Rhizocola hellebori]|uniref:MalT-like TPR region domain-containing protein n=1 Tax=Rhizocola hellebori TaxID=1392758 RepID=A0A8J3Q5R8_9ACTN|nr:hypothetical protein [Rhizocola hellebori]GIH04350.1 hypothetical protein Rhe02_24170 [Rhizocola hellebori]
MRGVPVKPHIESFLGRRVSPALRSSRDNQSGRNLRRAAASLIAIAGICAYDAEQHQVADGHFSKALHLAKTSGDVPLSGYVTALMANQALCLGKNETTILLVESALRCGERFLSAALQADLYSMQAKAHAQLGAYADCRQQMRIAERCVELINPADEPSETSYVHPGLMELKSAESLLKIGELDAAHAFAEASIRLGPADDPRGRFYSHAILAIVLGEQRKVEEGCPDNFARHGLSSCTGPARPFDQDFPSLWRQF